MIVRLTGDISGTRDGQDWPSRGSTVELPDDEAATLLGNGMAVPVVVDDVERAVPAELDVEVRALTTDTASAVGRKTRNR